ncbi:MAG: 2-oxoacid:ferredoxin oxidoreductase subunit beta [Candidatus Hydrogenedentes bacterium]|nr:2-oxoacid:ferredoxin oxidoreductase subunit beta [Candidatus Hydrogenedentota bacterium]
MSLLTKRHVIEGLQRAKTNKAQQHRDVLPTWCPGCGHFTPLQGVYEATERLNIHPKNLVLVSGIGCSGRFPFFVKGFGFHSLHGRGIPVATGIKIARPELTVVVAGGDGDGVGIGGGHFPHAARNNIDITYLLLDNSIYGLTKGQVSPTSPFGMISATTPYGNIGYPLNPSTLALTYGATFVARVFSRDRDECTEMVTQAIAHKGFSFVHVLSPCVEFNKFVTYGSIRETIAPLPSDYVPDDHVHAIQYAESASPVYHGVLFKTAKPTYSDHMQTVFEKMKGSPTN